MCYQCCVSIFTIILLTAHLWERTVELVDGVHDIQKHVVADNKFPLHGRRKNKKKEGEIKIKLKTRGKNVAGEEPGWGRLNVQTGKWRG